uniref:Hydroxymethylglutaryl-CoA synthase n=1 Tax=Pyxidicoccus sp. MCy9557 TaxID=2012863 RepID=A0A1Z2TJM1_9BACT|nr:hydroxymethylglutaryl-CoA synthase [Pyxidicoccus sp. MCy9557]
MEFGIEAANVYGGQTCLDVRTLFEARKLDLSRFENLMMEKKAVALPWEDAITNGVNAAKPIIDRLSPEERSRIEMVIAATESGNDFGKASSTYMHDYLGLHRNCRLFEVKQACYGGTAALQMALCFVASGVSPGAKALVIATDEARHGARGSYHEPSQGTGAVAVLVGNAPTVLSMDLGANGLYSYEVMDTCRPQPGLEAGDPDLSLLSYLECLQQSFRAYMDRVEGADFRTSFDYLVFHTPFAGMVKGAHRKMMRTFGGPGQGGESVEADFQRRMGPSLRYCTQVGNIYSATVFLALCGLIDHAPASDFQRVGLFSYGSGCASEFYSGTFTPAARQAQARFDIGGHLARRHQLRMEEYEAIHDRSEEVGFGTRDAEVAIGNLGDIYERQFAGRKLLRLERVKGFHREYAWT